uniref:VWFA domain-containing protein n=1 Tax=Neobodo designis TaxID=312471 RepID=A0A7S1W0M4_NEODS|mmetsp:Transcript_47947/g.147971  ORF Transcript_47947/g.147971 Transcript_47947/m.147971 type:complete len:682 (+) Transcript_47947:44-2089(+)
MRSKFTVSAVGSAIAAAITLCVVGAGAQSLSSVISAKEASLSSLASASTAQYQSRCSALSSCSSSPSSCAVPACGNGFSGRFGFDCTSAYGTNAGMCGSSCPGMIRSLNTSVVRFPDGVSSGDGETQAFACSTRRMDENFVSQNGTLRAWQYIGHDSGSIRIYPGNAQERTASRCGDYDARLRPWYTSATSGPKDIVIVIDRSGSMLNDNVPGQPNRGTRMEATVAATQALLGTLTPNDNVGVVTFSTGAEALGGFSALVRATNANVQTLSTAVGSVFADGSTNFNAGFQVAFNLIRSTTEDVNCNKVILFLTDGEAAESESEILANLTTWQAQLSRPAHIFTYSMSSASEDTIPQAIACAHQGVWAKIADGVDPLTKMRSYFQFLASGISGSSVRWTSVYEDAFGMGQMVTAALPVYDTTGGVARLAGVVGADITMAELQAFGDSATTVIAELYQRGRTCNVFSLSECQMQYLRQQSSAAAVCAAPTIASCDANNEIVRPSQCSAVSGGLNSALCTGIDATTRVAASGAPLTDAEVTCCACGGSGRGVFGSVLPGQGASPSGDSGSTGNGDEDGDNSTLIIVLICVIGALAIVVVVAVVIGCRRSRSAHRDADDAANDHGHHRVEVTNRRGADANGPYPEAQPVYDGYGREVQPTPGVPMGYPPEHDGHKAGRKNSRRGV